MDIDFNSVPYRYNNGEDAIIRGDKIFCPTCHKTLDVKSFFKSLDTVRHPSGYMCECRTCMTLMVDDSDPRTFLPILKEIDVPYRPSVWAKMMSTSAPSANTGTILGKYVSKMRLAQSKRYRWKDTEALVKQEAEQMVQGLTLQGKGQAEAEATAKEVMGYDINTGAIYINEQKLAQDKSARQVVEDVNVDSSPSAMAIYKTKDLTPETSLYGLTEEEIIKLKSTWGNDYNEEEFLQLEQLYNDMTEAYIIQDPIAVSNARIICKMTLKMNHFLDLDDIESVAKLSRQLDLFIKSANLAPVQQKDRQQTTFAISQLAYLCEQEGGFIPEFYIEEPNDKLDMILKDMKDYTNHLVQGESNIGEMVQNALAILEKDKEKAKELENYDEFTALENEVFESLGKLEPDNNEQIEIPIKMVEEMETEIEKQQKKHAATMTQITRSADVKAASKSVVPSGGRFGGSK